MTRLLGEHPLVTVEVDSAGRPVAITWAGRREPVAVCNRWRIEEGWWHQPILRDYYKVAGPRLLALLYQDGVDGAWHIERLYD